MKKKKKPYDTKWNIPIRKWYVHVAVQNLNIMKRAIQLESFARQKAVSLGDYGESDNDSGRILE